MKIRLPRPLKDQIEEAARASNRTLNGEVVSRLERTFREGEQGGRVFIPKPPMARLKALEDRVRAVEERLDGLETD